MCVDIPMLVDQLEHGRAALPDAGPVGDARGAAGRHTQAIAQREHRVEHRAGGAGQRAAFEHGQRRAKFARAADETRAIRLELGPGDHAALDHRIVRSPEFGLVRRAAPAIGDEGGLRGQYFGAHEHLRERRVRDVRRLGTQHQFGIGSDFHLARLGRGIADRHPAYLGIVFRRDLHFQGGRQFAIGADDLRPVLGEARFVRARLAGAGLVTRRPHAAGIDVPQQDEAAGVVARAVIAPASDREIVPPAVARACRGEHDRVAPVGEQVGLGRRIVRALEAAHVGHLHLGDARGGTHFLGARMRHGDVARCALLQQQVGGLHGHVPVETIAHSSIEQGVGDGDHRHALVVRHVRADGYEALALGDARRREVHGFVETIGAADTQVFQRAEVGQCRVAIDHGGEPGGVGRDHLVLGQAALEAQSRHAEVGILIGEFEIARVVRGLGDAPGHLELAAVLNLPFDDEPAGLRQQTTAGRAQHQVGHEVLEHRTRPGHQRGAGADGCDRAAEPEPMPRGDVALGDGDEAREARLGGQQVVAAFVQGAVAAAEADGQQLALAVVEEVELHVLGEFQRSVRQGLEILDDETGRIARQQVAAPAVDGSLGGFHPVQQVVFAVEMRFTGQRADHVHQRGGAFGGGGQRVLAGVRFGIRGAQCALEIGERSLDDAARDGEARKELELAQRLAREVERVGEPGQGFAPRVGILLPFAERARQRDQVRGEVARVHRRHVARVERAEVLGVVPVVEVAAILLHAAQCAQRGLDAIERVAQATPAEVARRDDRQ